MLWSRLMSRVAVTGYMGPFFTEFNLNQELLSVEYPFTYAHELAHRLGIASEAEANLYAYLVTSAAQEPAIRFSGYFSMAEISLAASPKVKLHQALDAGDKRAQKVLDLQVKPGPFFSVIQIGLNAIAILGGIIGETLFSPFFEKLFLYFCSPELASSLGFFCSFFTITMVFVLFADLIPKRIGLNKPVPLALMLIGSMMFLIWLFKPFVWLLTEMSNGILKLMGLPTKNETTITSEDILATVGAGTEAGLLDSSEQEAIENVMSLEDRLVTSAMTPRDSVTYFKISDTFEKIRPLIESNPHSKYLVCDSTIDRVLGYVDSKNLLCKALENDKFSLKEKGLVKTIPMIPDSLSFSINQFCSCSSR